ncbi:uncharacterized protein LOC135469107 [Liolophura sinensis]|uniref:uncharacterized protein LOC135469107 n=1 Tax=Liolophura sinensis TaxID=3198878 RepID=UPI00315816BC
MSRMLSTCENVSRAADLLEDKLHLCPGDRPPIVKTDLSLPDGQKKLAFFLENVMTKQECDAYIKKTEKMGYKRALLTIGKDTQVLRKDIRNSYRCVWDSEEQANILWQRIEPYIPTDFNSRWKPLGLNKRLRFLRYDPGEYFKPHYDGFFEAENGDRSFITAQLYLNEGFEGGSTTFLSTSGNDSQARPLVPRTGSVLIFQHNIFHEGSILVKGRKYAMRTDVMFTPVKLPDDA